MDQIRFGVYLYVIGTLVLDGVMILASARWLAGRHPGLVGLAAAWLLATVAIPTVLVLSGAPSERFWGLAGIVVFRGGFLALGGAGAFREVWGGRSGLRGTATGAAR